MDIRVLETEIVCMSDMSQNMLNVFLTPQLVLQDQVLVQDNFDKGLQEAISNQKLQNGGSSMCENMFCFKVRVPNVTRDHYS